MHKNYFWLIFLIAITMAVLWYTSKAAYNYYQYAAVNQSVWAKQVLWSIHHKSSDIYLLKADYTFLVDGKENTGSTIFSDPIFRNPWSAEDAIKRHTQHPWTVWHSTKDLTNSTLEHRFPWKELISAGVLWVLLAYFIGLGYYVTRFQRRI